jgi:hypothetical protein
MQRVTGCGIKILKAISATNAMHPLLAVRTWTNTLAKESKYFQDNCAFIRLVFFLLKVRAIIN